MPPLVGRDVYLEVRTDGVHEWVDHHPDDPTVWSLEEVLDGALDSKVRALWDDATVTALHAEAEATLARRRPG